MPRPLCVALGQHSDKGRKETNQDFHGAYVPNEPLLHSKGIAVAIADGIGSSNVSHIASEAAVTGFLEDYYCTSPAWSVKTSVQRVLMAVNSWLHSHTLASPYRYDKDRGYVCTLSALVIKASTAHVFHVGDSRVYRLGRSGLEQLTNDHRLRISEDTSYLSRALGAHPQIEIDYRPLPIEEGDTFLLTTDGVHEAVDEATMAGYIRAHGHDLDAAAKAIAEAAYERGSADNLTVQIVRVDGVPDQDLPEIQRQIADLPFPPELAPRMVLDGYTIVRELHASHRSRLCLARDGESQTPVVIKTPSVDLRGDAAYLERFLMEDWIARRIDSPHVLRAAGTARRRQYLYNVMEYVDGQTLTQWMIDNPRPKPETVRRIVEQIAKGLLAFHRAEMLHQDLRPDNVMIDRAGTVKIVDFGSTYVAGIAESAVSPAAGGILGTAQYTAPEYFLGEPGTTQSDLYSLGVIAYQMLSGRLPYGAEVAKARTRAAQRRLNYASVLADDREIPAWFDDVLRHATHPDPSKRFAELSELTYGLRRPSAAWLRKTRAPLIERNPVAFWRGLCVILLVIVVVLAARLHT
jgi:serine/threonine protein phosphatase PrpC